ncbi:MAG: two-component regulator propeller domain-containing protein [Nitrospinota bacterium]|nr:two-component regulator propeller domain-containing protein [Nitrospinota bacterium]
MGVIRFDTSTQDKYEFFDNKNGLLSNGIFAIAMDEHQRPWVGTYGGGLSFHDGTQWVNINTPQGLCDSFVYDIKFSGNSTWIATWSGANLVRGDPFNRKSWKSFTLENTGGGLIDNWVYAIEIGKDGRVWFGTESGVSVFDGAGWKNWNHSHGMGASFEAVKQDNRHVVSSLQGTHHTDHNPGLPNIDRQGYRPNYVVSMFLDKSERLWIGTWGAGLSLLDTQRQQFRNFTMNDGLPGNYIFAIEEGPYGNLWIGSNGGMSRFDGNRFTNYSKINGLVSDFIFSLEFSGENFLWAGGHHGMNQFKLNAIDGHLEKIQ